MNYAGTFFKNTTEETCAERNIFKHDKKYFENYSIRRQID